MRTTCTLLLVAGFVFSASIIQAEPGEKESFYRRCIDQKIKNCEIKARLVNSKGKHLRCCAQSAIDQASFYRDSKAELIQAMVQQNLPKKRYKVNHFLITTYSQTVNGDGDQTAGLRAEK